MFFCIRLVSLAGIKLAAMVNWYKLRINLRNLITKPHCICELTSKPSYQNGEFIISTTITLLFDLYIMKVTETMLQFCL